MIKKLLFIVCFFYMQFTFAQTFSKSYDFPHIVFSDIEISQDGGSLSLGTLVDSNGVEFFILMKTDSCGLMQWNILFKDSSRLDENIRASSLLIDRDGNYLVYGHVNNGPIGNRDLYIAKIDSTSKNIIWSKYYGGSDLEYAGWDGSGVHHNNLLIQTYDDNYLISAQTRTPYAGFGSSGEIIKINKTDGTPIWSKIYRLGSAGYFTNAIETRDTGLLMMGHGDPTGAGDLDTWVMKTDDTGAIEWVEETHHNIAMFIPDYTFSAVQTFDNGYAVLGLTPGAGGGIWILKYDEMGTLLWHRTYANDVAGSFRGRVIIETVDSGLVVVGEKANPAIANSSGFMFKVNSTGTLQWANSYNKTDGCATPGFNLGFFDVEESASGYIGVGDQLVKTDLNGATSCYNNSFTPPTAIPAITSLNVLPGIVVINVSDSSLNSDSISYNTIFTEYNMCYQVISDFKFDTITICPKDTVYFTDLSKIIFLDSANVCSDQSCCILNTWDWDFNDINSGSENTSTLQNPSHLFRNSGGFGITLASGFELCTQTHWEFLGLDGPVGFVQDTFICKGDSIQLDGNVFTSIDVMDYLWTPASSLDTDTIAHPLAFPTVTTLYTVFLIDSNPICNDTFSVLITVIDTLAAPNVVCDSNSLTYISFDWNDTVGATQYQISLDTGNTWINLTESFFDIGGFFQPGDSLTMLFRFSGPCGDGLISEKTCYTKDCDTANYTFLNDTAVCYGQPIAILIDGLNINNNPYSVIWNNGTASKDSSILLPNIYQAVTYTIEIIDSNQLICPSAYDTTNISVDTLPKINITVSPDTNVDCGSDINLYVAGAESYTWITNSVLNNTNIADPIATLINNSAFIVIGIDGNDCQSTDSVYVECTENLVLFVPNAMFVNSGGTGNNELKIYAFGITEFEFRIYDRFGKLVFYSDDQSISWDATFKGQNVLPGVYTYKINAITYDKSNIERKGNITVMW